MHLDAAGFSRPDRTGESDASEDATSRFRSMCPGEIVRAKKPDGSRRHPTMGSYFAVYEAWASDDEVRFVGSSGGALTALSGWMLGTGEASRILGASADRNEPRRTVSVQITTREQALSLAGSRYAPASNAADPATLDPSTVFVGKPCEASAVRALLGTAPPATDASAPIILSFFCAGTPSQHATDSLVEALGVPADESIRDLWYRGRGWPGRFTVTRSDAQTVSASYDESWGSSLGPATQWRCKICPDGVGESADVTAADFWRSDDRGYPDFSDGAGVSALIARTPRGLDLIARAVAAGVIVATPIDIDALARMQPLQRDRRETLIGRILGTVAAAGRVPRYRGFGLLALGLRRPRDILRAARGTRRRRRALGRSHG
jgi:coenzyme F420 hydrogenase subunit beta